MAAEEPDGAANAAPGPCPGSPPAPSAATLPPRDTRIPVHVLTGFLGAGKTTLLRHLLTQPALGDSAVFINEYGEVGIDQLLVEKIDENLVLLASGCLCCAVQGDLIRALKRLFMRALRREVPVPRRVLIETSGLADPAPVLAALHQDAFVAERFRAAGVVTAVDGLLGREQLAQQREASRQAALADRLLITKCDLATPAQRAQLTAELARLNPAAPVVEVAGGVLAPTDFLPDDFLSTGERGGAPGIVRWLGFPPAPGGRAFPLPDAASRHDTRIAAQALRFTQPLRWPAFSDALDALLEAHGHRILRLKGLLAVEGDPLPRVLHAVQHLRFPTESLAAWPSTAPFDDGCGRLVLIARALDPHVALELFRDGFDLPVEPA